MFRIVVGYDGSPAANSALETAGTLATRIEHSELLVVAAQGPDDVTVLDKVFRATARRKMQHEASTLAATVLAGMGSHPSPAEFVAPEGPPARAIAEVALKRQASLIVIGRTRRARLVDALLGSVFDRLLRQSPIPVMLVPDMDPQAQCARPLSETQVLRILVATDGSAPSNAALDYCVPFAQAVGKTHLTVLTVQPPPLLAGATLADSFMSFTHIAVAAEQAGLQILRQAGRKLEVLAHPMRLLNKAGQPGSAICRVAAEESAQLILVGSRCRSRLAASLLGSTSGYVAHNASVPVLIVGTQRA